MGAEGQFDPFLDEIIDSNDLPTRLPTPSEMAQDRADPGTWIAKTAPIQGSKHVLHEMAIVKSRLGFDEQAFREQCQRVHSELSQEFKEIVDEIYDMLDSVVADLSKTMHQMQVDQLRGFEGKLAEIRRAAVLSATMEQSIHAFLSQMQQAYTAAFNDQSRSN